MKLATLKDINDKDTVVIEISKEKEIVRMKGHNKVQKYFHRTFGHHKSVIKALLKAGLEEGSQSISVDAFLAICSDIEEKNRVNRSLKKLSKEGVSSFEDIEWENLPINNVRAKRAIKKVLRGA
jgi:hemoglobin-like flavoprotein